MEYLIKYCFVNSTTWAWGPEQEAVVKAGDAYTAEYILKHKYLRTDNVQIISCVPYNMPEEL